MAKTKGGCPGKDTAFLKDFKTNIAPCPRCGHEIEFFTDEIKVRCPMCHTNVFKVNPQVVKYRNGNLVFTETENSCIDWCGQCLDRRDYRDIEENKKRIEKKKEDLKELIYSVSKKERDVIDFFIEAYNKSISNPRLIDEKIFQMLQKENPDLFLRARNYYLNFINQ